MNERHLIDTNVFNIRFPSPQQAQAEQDNGLTDFIQDRLLRIVDQVFTRLCPPQTSIRIDTLELDLGALPSNGWRNAMAQRLEHELTKALREKIASLPKGGSGPERLLTPPQLRLDLLRCFLEHGCLPSHLSASRDDELEHRLRTALNEDSGKFLDLLASLNNPALAVRRLAQQFSAELARRISRLAAVSHPKLARLFAEEGLAAADSEEEGFRSLLLLAWYENRLEPLRQQWRKLFRQHGKALRRELFRHGQSAEVRRRMAWDFPEHIFADLIRLLEPNEHEFIEEIVFRPALPKESIVQDGESEDSGRKRLREFTLAYLLTERGSRFNKKEYLASLISRMAAHDNVNAADVIRSLQETLAALSSKSKVQQDMLDLLAEIHSDSHRQSLDEKQQDAARKAVQPEKKDEHVFSELLRQAFYQGLPDELRQQWHELFQQHGKLLRQELFRHGQTADVRQRIAWDFPDRIFADLIRLIEPNENEFIEEIVFRPVLRKEAGEAEEHGSRLLREFTLAYLLTERGSRFNKKEYLASLISRMAAHGNVNTADLTRSLQETLAALSSRSKVQQDMLLMLTEMQAEKPALQQSEAEPASLEQLLALLHERRAGKEFIEAVRRYAAQVRDQKQYCQLIAACLREDRSVDFEELLDQCGKESAGKPPSPIPSISSLEQLLTLLHERQAGKEFIEAVRYYAAQVSDQKQYCQLIAACLREDKPVDFEELLVQCGEKAAGTLPSPIPSISSLEQLLALLHERRAGKEFIEAVRYYAVQVSDQKQYCQLIAACLREDKPVDFEKLLVQCQQKTKKAAELPASLTRFPLSAAEQELTALLLRQETLTAAECAALGKLIQQLLTAAPARLRWLFETVLPESDELAERVAQTADERLLRRIFRLLRPAECAVQQAQADLLASACCAAPLGLSSETIQQLKRLFISQWLLGPSLRHREQDFTLAFAAFLHQRLNVRPRLRFFALLRTVLVQQADCRKQAKQRAEKLLRTELARLKQESAASRQAAAADEKFSHEPQDQFAEEIHVENAGMVLAATYLPRLFAMLGLLEKSAFRNPEAAERAVHLLQYLVEQRADRPEYQLALNKILCGVPSGQPIIREIEASEEEKETIDGLLGAVIQHWGALGSTSVSGLREAFLQRSGRLRLKDEAWHLEVEQKAYDMLLDRLPWSFSIIKLPWMQWIVHVKWR
jgi:hypothetical protein